MCCTCRLSAALHIVFLEVWFFFSFVPWFLNCRSNHCIFLSQMRICIANWQHRMCESRDLRGRVQDVKLWCLLMSCWKTLWVQLGQPGLQVSSSKGRPHCSQLRAADLHKRRIQTCWMFYRRRHRFFICNLLLSLFFLFFFLQYHQTFPAYALRNSRESCAAPLCRCYRSKWLTVHFKGRSSWTVRSLRGSALGDGRVAGSESVLTADSHLQAAVGFPIFSFMMPLAAEGKKTTKNK